MNLAMALATILKDIPVNPAPSKEERKRRAREVTVRGFNNSPNGVTRHEFKQKRYGAKRLKMRKRREEKRTTKRTRRMIDFLRQQESVGAD